MKNLCRLVFVFVTLFCLLLPASMCAQWSTNPNLNNAICTATNWQQYPTIISDGSGGAIITWYDDRNGSDNDIYAQRINASGTVQWTANGVAICVAAGEQSAPTIVSDGSGGAIITWHDGRSGTNYDIYAQRINTSGAVQWTANGVAICTQAAPQQYPTIATDGAGGAIITWFDSRSGTSDDIYAQRINASGTVQWTANGVAICTTTGDQDFPIIVSDGTGGAIITWYDGRGANNDIYAQHINSSGTVQWTANGVVICVVGGDQSAPTIVSDGIGGAIITWQDSRSGNYDIYAQRINASGTVQWTANGVAICTATTDQDSPTIASDGTGGAIITWNDQRNGNYDIYAQRIRSDSTKLWTTNGVAICTAGGNQFSPRILSDGTGGAIITWEDHRGADVDIYSQRINASGTVQWTANGVAICTATGNQLIPTIVNDGTGGAIVTWYDNRSGSYDIYAQRVDRLGNLYPEPWIDKVGDIANDQGGKLDVLWKPSNLDTWGNTSVRSYTVKMGVRTTGLLGKIEQTSGDGIYWRTVGSVAADWSDGYSMVISTNADSGLQGVPYYYLQVIAKNADSTVFWTSNVDSGFSIDNIPPVGISGSVFGTSGNGTISLQWNKDRVDPDLMGYEVYRSTTSGFAVDKANQLALSFDTTFTDTSVSFGRTYYYRVAAMDVHGNIGTPSSEMNQVALAVTLTSFTASSSHLSADLKWSTAAGASDYNFEIDRTTVGQTPSWQKVGLVPGSSANSSSQQYEFVDRDVSAGTYDYRIKLIAPNGGYAYTGTVEVQVGVAPKEFTLSQNYPNPFNPATTIEFSVPQDGRAVLKIVDVLGRDVATLFEGEAKAGYYQRVVFDATKFASGVYFSRLEFDGKRLLKKMVLMK